MQMPTTSSQGTAKSASFTAREHVDNQCIPEPCDALSSAALMDATTSFPKVPVDIVHDFGERPKVPSGCRGTRPIDDQSRRGEPWTCPLTHVPPSKLSIVRDRFEASARKVRIERDGEQSDGDAGLDCRRSKASSNLRAAKRYSFQTPGADDGGEYGDGE